MTAEAIRGAIARFTVSSIVLGVAATVFQSSLLDALLPFFRAWLSLVDGSFTTLVLEVDRSGVEPLIRRMATPAVAQVVGDMVVLPDASTRIVSSTAAGLALQPLVLGMCVVLAWPARGALLRTSQCLVALPLLLLVELLDVPLILVGRAWYSILREADPGGISALLYWNDFMHMGGRFALTILAGLLAISVPPVFLPAVRREGSIVSTA